MELRLNHSSFVLQLSGEEVFKILAKHAVIVVPGDDFRVQELSCTDDSRDSSESKEIALRLSYAASSADLIQTGVSRLVTGVKEILD